MDKLDKILVEDSKESEAKIKTFLLVCLFILFFCIPASIQVPFRVILLIVLNTYTFRRCNDKFLYFCSFVIVFFFILYKINCGSFDNSLLMVLLSVGPVLYFDKIGDELKLKINRNGEEKQIELILQEQ